MRNSCWLGSTPLKEEQTCPAQQCGCHLTGWGGSPQGWTNAAVPGSFLHAAASMLGLFGASLSCSGNRKHGGQSQPQTPGDLQGATGRPRAPHSRLFNSAVGRGCQRHSGALGSGAAAAGHVAWPVGQRDVRICPGHRLVPRAPRRALQLSLV